MSMVALQALPADATAEQRAAYAAASVAYMNVLPYLAPIYHPFGIPPNLQANFPLPTDASTGATGTSPPEPAAGAAAPDPSVTSTEQGSGGQTPSANNANTAEVRAAAVATAAVTASIEAARQMLQGHAAVVQKHLEALDSVQVAVRARQGPSGAATGAAQSTAEAESA